MLDKHLFQDAVYILYKFTVCQGQLFYLFLLVSSGFFHREDCAMHVVSIGIEGRITAKPVIPSASP